MQYRLGNGLKSLAWTKNRPKNKYQSRVVKQHTETQQSVFKDQQSHIERLSLPSRAYPHFSVIDEDTFIIYPRSLVEFDGKRDLDHDYIVFTKSKIVKKGTFNLDKNISEMGYIGLLKYPTRNNQFMLLATNCPLIISVDSQRYDSEILEYDYTPLHSAKEKQIHLFENRNKSKGGIPIHDCIVAASRIDNNHVGLIEIVDKVSHLIVLDNNAETVSKIRLSNIDTIYFNTFAAKTSNNQHTLFFTQNNGDGIKAWQTELLK